MAAAPVVLAQDGYHITLNGQAGHLYQILSSSSFTDWETIGTETNTNGQVEFNDPAAGSSSAHAYRVIQIQ